MPYEGGIGFDSVQQQQQQQPPPQPQAQPYMQSPPFTQQAPSPSPPQPQSYQFSPTPTPGSPSYPGLGYPGYAGAGASAYTPPGARPPQAFPQQQQQQQQMQQQQQLGAPSTDAALVEAIRQQTAAFTQQLEEQRAALTQQQQASAPDPQQQHQQQLQQWQAKRQELVDTAATKFQEQCGAGNYAEAAKQYQQALDKIPPPPQPQQATRLEDNVMLRSMQSDALGRAAERDPFLHRQYGKEIKAELNKLPVEARFTSEGVQQAEALIRGKHYNELMQAQQQQQYQQWQQQQWQQQQQYQQLPPQSLPRPDLGENMQSQLYNLPAAARQVAYELGVPLEQYAQHYAEWNGDGAPARSVDSLEGSEGVLFIPEGEEAALEQQRQAAQWQRQQAQAYPMGPMGPGMANPYAWAPGQPQMQPQMQMQPLQPYQYPQINAPFV